MTKKTRSISIAALAVTAVIGLSACTSGTPTQQAPLDRTNSVAQSALTDVWNATSSSEQDLLCDFYLDYPQEAFAAFDEGAGGLIPQTDFTVFFDAHC